MNQLFRQNLVEALIGLLVLIVAIIAVLFFYQRTSAATGAEQYTVSAFFENASGVSQGTDVRMSGVTIGQVTGHTLEEEFPFRARLSLAINDRYQLPADTSASITSEGILGGNYISLTPGGDTETLREGDQIMDTQGSVDLMSMVGQFINQTGGDEGGSGGGGDFGSLDEPSGDDDFGVLSEDGAL